jgi:hypothetical protein
MAMCKPSPTVTRLPATAIIFTGSGRSMDEAEGEWHQAIGEDAIEDTGCAPARHDGPNLGLGSGARPQKTLSREWRGSPFELRREALAANRFLGTNASENEGRRPGIVAKSSVSRPPFVGSHLSC